MSTRNDVISLRTVIVTPAPLILAILLPLSYTVLEIISVPSSASIPLSFNISVNSAALKSEQSKQASTKQLDLPDLMRLRDALAPSIRLMASTIRLLPAPVSPLITLSPYDGSKTILDITAKSRISSLISISSLLHKPAYCSYQCLCFLASGRCHKYCVVSGNCPYTIVQMN